MPTSKAEKPGQGPDAVASRVQRTLVMKFGGTSVGDAAALRQVVAIVHAAATWDRLVLVTSALSGVTNQLVACAANAAGGQKDFCGVTLAELRTRHFGLVDELVPDRRLRAGAERELGLLLDEFANLCQAVAVLGEATPRVQDAITSLGERMSVVLLAAVLRANGRPAVAVDARSVVVTDDRYQDAHPDLDATRVRSQDVFEPLLAAGQIPVVTGFLGATPEGSTTTLGRGGSDYSAAILGSVLPAREVWIWTDVDGVMTADPRLVPSARTIPELSYHEVAELAYFGARVLHPKTIRPIIEAGIPLRICNTFRPDLPGTRIIAAAGNNGNGLIKAVTAIHGHKLVTIEGRGMLGVPGVAATAFSAVAATGTSVIFITQASSEQSICFAVPLESAARVVAALEEAFARELARRDIDRVWSGEETVIVTVVGAGMRQTPGISGRIFSALGAVRVNVIAIAQGSSEAAISMVVAAQDAEAAVRALHELTQPGGQI